jgi:hypothetical protein
MLNDISCDVLVFRTSIRDEKDREKVADVLMHESHIRRWSVDHDDVDKVLRVESEHLLPDDVIRLIRKAGFECEELPD